MQFFRRFHAVQALSFDLDDTLYDNVPVMERAERAGYQALCERYPQAAQWSQQQWADLRHRLMQSEPTLAADMTALRLATLERGLRQLGTAPEQARAGAEQVFAIFLSHRNKVEVRSATHQLLHDLASRYPLVALSNGNVDTAAIGLRDYFDVVVQPHHAVRGKPHPDMFALAAAQFSQIAPQSWLHIGDSPTADVLGAHRYGWQSAWFRQGLYADEALVVLPTFAFDQLEQLRPLLLD